MTRIKLSLRFLFLFQLMIVISGVQLFSQNMREIWVSPAGNDAHAGTIDKPLATLLMAQRKARELRRLGDPSIEDGIKIIVKGGVYRLNEPLLFRTEDSGTADSPTLIAAAKGEIPIISGGVNVEEWKKLSGAVKGLSSASKNKIWVADIPSVGGRRLEFRQLWVNGSKAERASTLTDGVLDRILSVDNKNETLWIPKPKFKISEIKQLEFVIHQWWAIANLRVKDIRVVGDSAAVTFHQPESRIEFEHPWPAPYIDKEKNKNGNSAFYFVNSIGLLNNPGEWYADSENGKVYYWPRNGESMYDAEVVVPYLETLVEVNGTIDSPVRYVYFEGLNFEYVSWMRPSQAGHVPLQAGFYLLDAYNLPVKGTPDKATLCNQAWLGRQKAAVAVNYANNLKFEKCRFLHMAATAIDLIRGTNNNLIQGCLFSDIGGTAIQIGFFGDASFEAHMPYNPVDRRELCHHETISNNLITNVTNEDWGCVGVGVGFAHDVSIVHNEISHLNYSGISVGWGWTKSINCMKNNSIVSNHIHHFAKNMYDVGGVYMLSAQPNSEIRANSIHDLEKAPYTHDPNHYQYIYYDEGSSFIRSVDNWTQADKFFSNSPGPGNEWINNGPQVADSIKNAAGLLPEYRYLLNCK